MAASRTRRPSVRAADPVDRLVYVSGGELAPRRERRDGQFVIVDADALPVTDGETLGRVGALRIPPAWIGVWISTAVGLCLGPGGAGRLGYRSDGCSPDTPAPARSVRAGAGWRNGVVGNCVIPTGRGSPAGYALLAGEPLIVEDMTADTPFEVPSVLRDHGVMSDITVVIDPSGQPFGTLVAASGERRSFSEDDVSFVQSVANVLAIAIARARSEERLQSAQETERSRIARALHDEALSSLADALALAVAARRASPESAPSSRLVAVLRRVGQQLRGAIYDLSLDLEKELQAPFPGLLEQLVAVHRARGVDCEIELENGATNSHRIARCHWHRGGADRGRGVDERASARGCQPCSGPGLGCR